jgi:PAS domain S-box-containing protein
VRLLLIDHDHDRAVGLAVALTGHGHQVVSVPTAADFAVHGVPFSVVIVDWDTPGLQIGRIGRIVRVAAQGRPVGVIVLATDVSMAETHRFADALVTDYQKKPADPDWIAKRLVFIERTLHQAAGHERVTETEHLFRRTSESAPLALLALDDSGRVKLSEGGALRKLGIPASGVLGRSIFEIYEDVGPLVEQSRRALAGETVRARLAVDGRVLQTQYTPDRDAGGNVVGVFAVSTDITEQYEAEENLRRSEAGFRSLIEQSSDGTAVHQDGVVLYANAALAAYFEYAQASELLGAAVTDLVPEAERAGFEASARGIKAVGQRAVLGELSIVDRQGASKPAEVSSVGVVFDGALAVVTTFRDLSERKRIEEQQIALEKSERERLAKELEIARHIQTSLLPRAPAAQGLDIAAQMVPASEIGGDYYDLIPADDHQCWIGIGDVAGHGLDAGLIMLMVQTTISALTRRAEQVSPAHVLRTVNDVIYDNLWNRLAQRTFVTLTLLHHDGAGGFTFAGAHEDMVVLRAATGRCERIETPGPWLGTAKTIERKLVESRMQLSPGDLLFLYTDGITEARDAGGKQFGLSRVCEAIEERASAPVDDICRDMLDLVARWHVRQEDDLTVMVIRYRGPRQAAGAP